MGQSVGPNSVRPWTSAAGPYIVSTAREQVAELIGAHPLDVIFTSCATESNNAAIAAALRANPTKRHIVTSQVEHSSVLNYCMALERKRPKLAVLTGIGGYVHGRIGGHLADGYYWSERGTVAGGTTFQGSSSSMRLMG